MSALTDTQRSAAFATLMMIRADCETDVDKLAKALADAGDREQDPAFRALATYAAAMGAMVASLARIAAMLVEDAAARAGDDR